MHVSSIMNGELAYMFGIRDQASASQLCIKEDKVLCHEFLGVLPSCMCAHTYIYPCCAVIWIHKESSPPIFKSENHQLLKKNQNQRTHVTSYFKSW